MLIIHLFHSSIETDLPIDVQASVHRSRATHLLHSCVLFNCSSALRVEDAAHVTLSSGSDPYLTAMTRLAFALAKPELAPLKLRIIMADPGIDLHDLVRVASSHNGDLTKF